MNMNKAVKHVLLQGELIREAGHQSKVNCRLQETKKKCVQKLLILTTVQKRAPKMHKNEDRKSLTHNWHF
jgi:hypothetical protein